MTLMTQVRAIQNSFVRPPDSTIFRRRRAFDRALRFVRSCAVCTSILPPIDFLCPRCWQTLGRLMNRGEALKQPDYSVPTYSLLTWTPQTEPFVKPLIYAFKGGYAALASEKLSMLFLSEYQFARSKREAGPSVLIPAPAQGFDHSALWSQALASQTMWPVFACLEDKKTLKGRQKDLRAGERGLRRFGVMEHFPKAELEQLAAKRIVFADDVVTSGSTAMAAFMALGDPERFEVWSLVARPRLAAKQGAC